jgi:glycogen debranching enzyme
MKDEARRSHFDRDGAPCRVISSNPAHCLWTGLLPLEQAGRIRSASWLGSSSPVGACARSGLAERRYNPMSYTRLGVAARHGDRCRGLRRCGFTDEFLTLASGLFAAAQHATAVAAELFCGFPRLSGYGPTPYPSRARPRHGLPGWCPRSWPRCSGWSQARDNRLTFRRPVLPEWLPSVEVRGLRLGQSRIDVVATRGRVECRGRGPSS